MKLNLYWFVYLGLSIDWLRCQAAKLRMPCLLTWICVEMGSLKVSLQKAIFGFCWDTIWLVSRPTRWSLWYCLPSACQCLLKAQKHISLNISVHTHLKFRSMTTNLLNFYSRLCFVCCSSGRFFVVSVNYWDMEKRPLKGRYNLHILGTTKTNF